MSSTGEQLGAVPAGDGVVWDCTKMGFSPLTVGNMAPMIWLGNDSADSVSWRRATAAGAQDLPDEQLLRQGGEIVLRLNIIQEPSHHATAVSASVSCRRRHAR